MHASKFGPSLVPCVELIIALDRLYYPLPFSIIIMKYLTDMIKIYGNIIFL